jgi:asparaginyl-tRNA synthetase
MGEANMIYAVAELLSGAVSADTEVVVNGWVRTRRDSKAGVSFIQLHDGSCFAPVQIVVPQELANYTSEVLKLTAGCALTVKGKLVKSQGQEQAYEVQATELQVVGWVEDPETYPIQPKRHTMEFLRTVAHLRPRTNTFSALTRVRHCVALAIHQFFDQQGFFWINTPIITASDCEGAGELFRVSTLDMLNPPRDEKGKIDFKQDFFGREAFLTVSGQLNGEAYALAMSKIYTFGPTFRAENSNTSRHLAEFWMVEPEIAFAGLSDIAALAERLLKQVCQTVLSQRADDMAFFAQWVDKECIQRLEKLSQDDFVHMEYSEAISILEKANQKFEYNVAWGIDLQSEHERYIAEDYVGKPVIMMNYPKDIKGFYMRQNDDGKTVAAMDVLAPGIGEIIGGSQREERFDYLDKRMGELNLDKEIYRWYLDLRAYGTVPHAGFGLGFERLISYITGVKNVRDVIPFPRVPGSAAF